MDTVRVGIIGVGNMGSAHARSIAGGLVDGMTLAAIADIKASRREWAKETFPGIAVFDDAIAMMDSGLVDAIIVATPHYFHPVYVTEALKRDIHALSEKPAGVYTKAVREVNELAAKSKATYAIMFNQRTNCVYRKMKEIVASGELGNIRRVNWLITNWYRSQAYYDSGAWRATWDGEGGGVLMNQCPHNLDLIQWICGMPNKIQAFVHEGKWHDIEVEDDVTAYMEYPNGATGLFITSTGDAVGTNRFEIEMDGGKLVVENGKLIETKLEMTEQEFSKVNTQGFGRPEGRTFEVETDGLDPEHNEVLRRFAHHILDGEPLVADGKEAINGLMLANAMSLSGWLGRAVELPIDEDLFLSELNKRRATSRIKTGDGQVLDTQGSYNNK